MSAAGGGAERQGLAAVALINGQRWREEEGIDVGKDHAAAHRPRIHVGRQLPSPSSRPSHRKAGEEEDTQLEGLEEGSPYPFSPMARRRLDAGEEEEGRGAVAAAWHGDGAVAVAARAWRRGGTRHGGGGIAR